MGFVSLATDFGDAYTAICAGVIYRIAPAARVLVLSDQVPKYAVRHGAMLLAQALPYLPVGVHVGIIDPGVGTARRPVAVATGRGDVLVGPDNGLLPLAADALGGATAAYHLVSREHRLPEVSATFHGRDVFAPAAGHLATGTPVTALGPPILPESLISPELPPATVGDSSLSLVVGYADEFGNLVLCGTETDLVAAFGPLEYGDTLTLGGRLLPYRRTYGDVPPGEPLLYLDSSGWLGIAVNQDSAARRLGLREGDLLTFTK